MTMRIDDALVEREDRAPLRGAAITLRPATLDDAALLLAWRNDAATREASHRTGIIAIDEHVAWLGALLADPARRLFIAEAAGKPVGTLRADGIAGVVELSWTVAPEARGRGLAKHMVTLLAKAVAGPIVAEIKEGNTASIRVAEAAGMTLARRQDGVLHFRRDALRPDG